MNESRIHRALFPVAVSLTAAYFAITIFFDRRTFGIWFGLSKLVAVVVTALIAAVIISRFVERRPEWLPGLVNLSTMLLVLVVALVTVDAVTSVYLSSSDLEPAGVEAQAAIDPMPFTGELYPPYYFPTTAFYRIYKPNVTIVGDHYGLMYTPRLSKSATLRDSVFQKQHVTVSINAEGLRDKDLIDSCHVAALGDSFTFGNGMTEGATWVDHLERMIGQCVLNFGISGGAPIEEMMAFRHHMRQHAGRADIRTIIWMIYEANDLEDGHPDTIPVPRAPTLNSRVRSATILGGTIALVQSVKHQSLIRKAINGSLQLKATTRTTDASYTVDGIPLMNPLFRSPARGYMMAYKLYLDRAAMPMSYVLNEPNRPAIDRSFAEMKKLADSLHANVYVVLMPSGIRVHAADFPFQPAPSTEPHFLNYTAALARKNGFESIEMLKDMHTYARDSLLYFRDDDHLNRYGNEVVATLLARHLRTPDPKGDPSVRANR